MKQFSIKEHFDIKIRSIWDNPKFENIEYIKRGYTQQDSIILNALLFIGINPSYSGSDNNSIAQYYNVQQTGDANKYFKKFQEISDKVKMDWSHIDLLFLRETEQKKVESLMNNSVENSLSFIYEQLLISKEIIEKAMPKIIVVNNTLARRLLGKHKEKGENIWMGFDFEFDKIIGTYRIINHETLTGTPVFFTSMLTGQRALDLGSYERLIWHINFVKEHL